MKTLRIETQPGFSLQAASAFYESFTPGSGMAAAAVDRLTFAFHLDGSFTPVAACLREQDGGLRVDYVGTRDESRVHRQLTRMLGLEADGAAWLALGKRVPLVGALQREFPGFYTASKGSPYDAAVWSIISPRMNMELAARIKQRIAREHGTAVELHGRVHHVFPTPERLLELQSAEGLSGEKVNRLQGVAQAALDGKLDVARLRSLCEPDALSELQTIRGIGPWSASHIYHRGAAPADCLPLTEPRILHGYALASETPVPSMSVFRKQAEAWRPFRTWVCVLLMRHLARTDQWRNPMLRTERAAAGRAATR